MRRLQIWQPFTILLLPGESVTISLPPNSAFLSEPNSKAISSLQDILSGLGGDLGTAYRTPIYLNEPSKSGSSNNHPAVVFCLIRHVKDPKSVVSLSLKWVPMSRVQKLPNHGNHAIDSGAVINDHNLKANSRMESLCLTIREQMIFQQVSQVMLDAKI